MLKLKFVRARKDPRRHRYLVANPLWTLEELRNLRNPPFVADPEFTPFDIDALGCDPKSVPALLSESTQVRPSKHRRLHTVGREFPIPPLVGGLPWRYAENIKRPVVPESEFAPLDLSCIGA
jgi:hypothetical protein